ncbi:MAG: 16S rRNA (guanine(966)-N(2))-methyltransferase RsmD [Desulfovibrio sp.]|nr:16S rRNA (guanine(966)-N(2))-methyltransferase RsmD [Desulfovibrio sp.]
MRIIAGFLKHRLIQSPPGRVCRPAMGRTREALFSMLEARGVVWEQTPVLDVFAGSGSLAFEAISRGAVHATLLENDSQVVATIRDNAKTLDVVDRITIVQGDAIRLLRKGSPTSYPLVFLDPPYRKSYTEASLRLLANGWLTVGAMVVCEVERSLALPIPPSYTLDCERRFGQTMVYIVRYAKEPMSEG